MHTWMDGWMNAAGMEEKTTGKLDSAPLSPTIMTSYYNVSALLDVQLRARLKLTFEKNVHR